MSQEMPLAPGLEHDPYVSVRPFPNKKHCFVFRHRAFLNMFQIQMVVVDVVAVQHSCKYSFEFLCGVTCLFQYNIAKYCSM